MKGAPGGVWRKLQRLAAGGRVNAPRWALHRAMFDQAHLIVAIFYVVTAAYLYEEGRRWSHLADPLDSLDLLWPVEWIAHVGVHAGGRIIANLAVVAGLLGLVLWRLLPVRMLVSVAILLCAAYSSSRGAINHGYHEWFWISVCFWLLPGVRKERLATSRAGRMRFLTAFSLAPLLILFFYTLSGAYKCWYAADALLAGRTGGFSPDAMAITIAWRAIQTGSEPLWAALIIDHPLLGWPFFLGLYFVELVSVLVFFRPALHRAWGVILIAFHFGTLTFMDIVFDRHVLINGLLFVMSPFALGHHPWRSQVVAVPVFGGIFRRIEAAFRRRDRSEVQAVPAQQAQREVPAEPQDGIAHARNRG